MSFIIKGIDLPKDFEAIAIITKSGKASCMYGTDVIQISKDHGNIIDESKAVVTETIDGYYEINRAPMILEAEE